MVKDPSLPTGVAELLAQSGFAAVPIAEGDGFKRLDKKITWLETSIKAALAQMTVTVAPVLAEIKDDMAAYRLRLDSHDTKHTKHETEITGLHKRLVIVEEIIVTKRTGLRRKKRKK